MQRELRHEEVFPIYGKGEAQFLPYMGKSARQGLAALILLQKLPSVRLHIRAGSTAAISSQPKA